MPNHITNRLRITNVEPEQAKAFWKSIADEPFEDGSPCLIDFNKIMPMPPTLMIECSSRAEEGLKLHKMRLAGIEFDEKQSELIKDDPKLLELGRQAFENLRDYGHRDWYDWCRSNWGTKWNAYDQTRIDDNTIEFLTAWCGVSDLMRTLSEQNPDACLEYMYADENWSCNVGQYEFQNGDTIYANEPEDMSEEAEEIACELLGDYDCEEEGEEM
ncbi:hypothetical protein FACS1894202_14750 [Clostridia bacterium]|nr:hypothetical protein FACS1894202_14750 [Clostridia bacterium]